MGGMTHPTSLRFPASVKERLERRAGRNREAPASLAVRLVDEGLRMADHPGVGFHDSPAHGRVACLLGGPDVAEVIDVLDGLEARGEARLLETATWFSVDPSRIRAALSYHVEHGVEIDEQVSLRRQEADELRRELAAQDALLG